jgi:hypothetical protein
METMFLQVWAISVSLEQNYETWISKFRISGRYSWATQHLCGFWIFTSAFLVAVVYKGELYSCLIAQPIPRPPAGLAELVDTTIPIGTTSAFTDITTGIRKSLLKEQVLTEMSKYLDSSYKISNLITRLNSEIEFLNGTIFDIVRNMSIDLPVKVGTKLKRFGIRRQIKTRTFAVMSEHKETIFFKQLMSKVKLGILHGKFKLYPS